MKRNMIPCPSPRGTNFERLFLVRAPERMAMDQALEENEAEAEAVSQADAVSRAYGDLYSYLESTSDEEGLARLKDLMNCMTNGGAMDRRLGQDVIRRHVAAAAKVRAGRTLKQISEFNERFPNAARIRNV